MKSIILFYFSGTGNTKYVSKMLTEELKQLGGDVSINSIDSTIDFNNLNINKYDLIGLAYPIYGFGTPDIIFDFVKKLPTLETKNLFILKTAADYISINHSSSLKLSKTLKRKGYNLFYDRIIVMPSNWVVEYNDSLEKQLLKVVPNKVRHMSKELLTVEKRVYKPNIMLQFLSNGVSYFEENLGARYFGKSLYSNDSCTNCGKCIIECPKKNISTKDSKLHFSDSCIWCMRCIYSCPQNAIRSKGMGFCIFKGGYNLNKIIYNTDESKDFLTTKTKGFFRHLYTYIADASL